VTYRKIILALVILTMLAVFVAAAVITPQMKNISEDVLSSPKSDPTIYISTDMNYGLKTPWYAAAWVRNQFHYRMPLPYRWQMPRETLRTGRGVCIDYATLLCSLCRSEGMDAWVVVGTIPGSLAKHAWVVSGKYIMDFQHNYLKLPAGWHELYRFNEKQVIEVKQ
jgi:hypothetical protein